MLLRRLVRHRWKRLLRGGVSGARLFKGFAFMLLAAYFGFSLAAVGVAFSSLAEEFAGVPDPVGLLNVSLLTAFAALLGMRFFAQRALKMDIQPYLHLPVPEGPLVRFAQVASLSTLFNLFPFCFAVPFWLREIAGVYGAAGAFGWLAGVTLCVLATHYATNWLRLLVLQNTRRFLITGFCVAALLGLDALFEGLLVGALSRQVFGGLLAGQLLWLLPLVGVLVALFALSSRQLQRSLRDHTAGPTLRLFDRPAAFSPTRSATANLMRLDLKLLLRNKRPRNTVGLSAFFGIAYVPLMLAGGNAGSVALNAFVGFFALILGASSYGQYLFAWDSEHFDGLLARPFTAGDLVRARLLLLQAFGGGSFVVILPFFIWLAPQYLLLLVALLFYGVGVACPSLLLVALWNRKRVRLDQGGLFNYEGLSVQQFIVNIPMLIPPGLLLLLLSDAAAVLAIGGLGLLGAVLFPLWIRLFRRLLACRRYRMAAGFRSFDE